MKRDLTDLLCCPDCQSDLSLHDETPSQPEVETGYVDVLSRAVRCIRFCAASRASSARIGTSGASRTSGTAGTGCSSTRPTATTSRKTTFAEKSGFRPEELRGKLVLDVGCGAGRFLDVASRWGARAVGVDLSFAVEASHKNLGERPQRRRHSGRRLPPAVPDQTFDAIFSLGVLHHSRDTREAFLQLPPLLKDGGDIAVWLYYYPDRALLRRPATSGASCSGRCRRGPCTRGRGCSSRSSRICGSSRSCRARPGCTSGGCCRSTRTRSVTGECWTRSTGTHRVTRTRTVRRRESSAGAARVTSATCRSCRFPTSIRGRRDTSQSLPSGAVGHPGCPRRSAC